MPAKSAGSTKTMACSGVLLPSELGPLAGHRADRNALVVIVFGPSALPCIIHVS